MNLQNYLIVSLIVVSYFLGSISFAKLVAKTKNIDLRKEGSGNLGATNVYRTMGIGYALTVFLLDATKGFIPVAFAMKVLPQEYWIHIIVGLSAIVGHSLSIFAEFKGGKGVATGLGVIGAISPLTCGILFITAAILIKLTRFVAPVSISCSILAPVLLAVFEKPKEYIIFVAIISIFIIWRHRSNIGRLLAGTENRV